MSPCGVLTDLHPPLPFRDCPLCPAAENWASSDYDSAYYSPDHAAAAAYTTDAGGEGAESAGSPGGWDGYGYGYGDGAVAAAGDGTGADPTWDQTAAWNWTDMEPTSGYDTGG